MLVPLQNSATPIAMALRRVVVLRKRHPENPLLCAKRKSVMATINDVAPCFPPAVLTAAPSSRGELQARTALDLGETLLLGVLRWGRRRGRTLGGAMWPSTGP